MVFRRDVAVPLRVIISHKRTYTEALSPIVRAPEVKVNQIGLKCTILWVGKYTIVFSLSTEEGMYLGRYLGR